MPNSRVEPARLHDYASEVQAQEGSYRASEIMMEWIERVGRFLGRKSVSIDLLRGRAMRVRPSSPHIGDELLLVASNLADQRLVISFFMPRRP
jgi:hypothetical protein